MKTILWLLVVLGILLPQTAWANRAEIMLIPTRVVMENKDRYTTIVIKNIGNATGYFSVDMIDMAMKEDGIVVPLEEGKTDPYSAIPYLRAAPKSITLKPGEAQNVRVMLRKPDTLPAGEYRSHMRVKVEDDNVEATEARAANPEQKDAQIQVKANLVLIIPVIVRHGETTLSVKIESPEILRDSKGRPQIGMSLLRDGTRSSMGDFTFSYTAPGGKAQQIKTFPGIPVYRSIARRQVVIPLDDIPAEVDLTKGKLDIVYSAQEKDGGQKLAEMQMDLSAQ